MLIEVGGVFVMFNLIGINEMISKLVTQVIVIIGNYFISKLLVFKNNPTRKEK
jgi:putative flippase GtrA